jgi:hypothetical protein
MSWPSQGVLVFAVMSAIAPVTALIGGNVRGFARSAPIAILAALLAGSTYLVPVAIVLLIVSFVLASQQFTTRNLWRAVRRAPFVAIGAYMLWLSLAFNWSPPTMLERAFVDRTPDQRIDQTMTDILNSQFPHGTNEVELKLVLVGQGFEGAGDARPECRSALTPSYVSYTSCPRGRDK